MQLSGFAVFSLCFRQILVHYHQICLRFGRFNVKLIHWVNRFNVLPKNILLCLPGSAHVSENPAQQASMNAYFHENLQINLLDHRLVKNKQTLEDNQMSWFEFFITCPFPAFKRIDRFSAGPSLFKASEVLSEEFKLNALRFVPVIGTDSVHEALSAEIIIHA